MEARRMTILEELARKEAEYFIAGEWPEVIMNNPVQLDKRMHGKRVAVFIIELEDKS